MRLKRTTGRWLLASVLLAIAGVTLEARALAAQPVVASTLMSTLSGSVRSVNGTGGLFVTSNEKSYYVRVNTSTSITLNGAKAGLGSLAPGDGVRVTFVVGPDGQATDLASSVSARRG